MLTQLREQEERKLGRISAEESAALNRLNALFLDISQKYKVNYDNIAEILKKRENYLTIPASIFNNELSPLENVVLYLNIKFGLSQTEIAHILGRDHTTIWTTLTNAGEKIKIAKFKEIMEKGKIFVPIQIFSDEKLSVLEGMSIYMKEKMGMSYHEIATILGKDDRTIWTVVNRGMRKLKR